MINSGNLLAKLSQLSHNHTTPCHFTNISYYVYIDLGFKFFEGRFYFGM